jgi:allantoicase
MTDGRRTPEDEMTTDFRELVDLASERLGGSVLYATDDFFAEKENLIKPAPPVWKEQEYTDRGKWMDGWESRRKRTPGHDFAILRLGARGVVRGIVVDTSFFRGNYPESCSLDACSVEPESSVESLLAARWTEILPKSALKGDSQNVLAVDTTFTFSHLRFHIYPDGGAARLRVHGDVVPDWHRLGGLTHEIDLAAVEHGGEVLTCSDMFFGPKHNLIMPGRPRNMSEGWETRRRRGPGHDWVIVKLATEGMVQRIELDTAHFKGNYPDTASIEASRDGKAWSEILPRTKMQPDTRHIFVDELSQRDPVTHVRLNVYPDGGVARLRVYGIATEEGRGREVTRRINTLVNDLAASELRSCCGSSEWVSRMIEARPFRDWSDLLANAEKIWRGLEPREWREAFAAHPRIGEKSAARWSSAEQAATTTASAKTMKSLAAANRAYEEHFGHIYIVSATGKNADEMLAMAQQRMQNRPEEELRVAAEEQWKIMKLRLMKLVE